MRHEFFIVVQLLCYALQLYAFNQSSNMKVIQTQYVPRYRQEYLDSLNLTYNIYSAYRDTKYLASLRIACLYILYYIIHRDFLTLETRSIWSSFTDI